MATTIAEIIALWADLEYQLAMLLTNIIGVSESPTLAIFSILQTQQLQAAALKAAAQSALTSSDYEVFAAGIAVADSVDTARHQLAHWLWAKCEQRPDLLCLVDPRKLKGREIESGSLPLEAYQCILALSAVSGQLRPGLLRSQFHPDLRKSNRRRDGAFLEGPRFVALSVDKRTKGRHVTALPEARASEGLLCISPDMPER